MFLVFDDDSMGGYTGSNEVSKELVLKVWNGILETQQTGEDISDVLERLEGEDQWPEQMPTSYSVEQVQRWVNELNSQGKVSDTEENTCWAIAETEQMAQEWLKQEIAKFE